MLREEPGDPFLMYGLAMEHQREGDDGAALALFTRLQQGEPPYVPAFFRCGQMLVDLGRIEEARTALRHGIEQARLQGDAHAAGEMSELLMDLGGR